MSDVIGILGGMGPLATVDFVSKIIAQTSASRDQDHLPLLVHSVPQIPDRTACLMEDHDSPLEALERGLSTLIDANVGCIAIPCNTAHFWYPSLQRKSPVPILHIAQACAEQLQQNNISKTALMATDGTLKAGFYPQELSARGIELILPEAELQQRIMAGIYQVKAGAVDRGASILESCMLQLLGTGVECVILGCTEIPFALDRIQSCYRDRTMDATSALATACISWYRSQQSLQAA